MGRRSSRSFHFCMSVSSAWVNILHGDAIGGLSNQPSGVPRARRCHVTPEAELPETVLRLPYILNNFNSLYFFRPWVSLLIITFYLKTVNLNFLTKQNVTRILPPPPPWMPYSEKQKEIHDTISKICFWLFSLTYGKKVYIALYI